MVLRPEGRFPSGLVPVVTGSGRLMPVSAAARNINDPRARRVLRTICRRQGLPVIWNESKNALASGRGLPGVTAMTW